MAYVVYYESADQTTLVILRISAIEPPINSEESRKWLDKPDLYRLRALLGGSYRPCTVYTPQHRHDQADQIMYLIL